MDSCTSSKASQLASGAAGIHTDNLAQTATCSTAEGFCLLMWGRKEKDGSDGKAAGAGGRGGVEGRDDVCVCVCVCVFASGESF
jgi:hypothetical protein